MKKIAIIMVFATFLAVGATLITNENTLENLQAHGGNHGGYHNGYNGYNGYYHG